MNEFYEEQNDQDYEKEFIDSFEHHRGDFQEDENHHDDHHKDKHHKGKHHKDDKHHKDKDGKPKTRTSST